MCVYKYIYIQYSLVFSVSVSTFQKKLKIICTKLLRPEVNRQAPRAMYSAHLPKIPRTVHTYNYIFNIA